MQKILTTAFLLLCCTLLAQTGTIKGILNSNQSKASCLLKLKGTNFSAVTDTAGCFTFVQIPVGSYTLLTERGYLVLDGIQVQADQITDVGKIEIVEDEKLLKIVTITAIKNKSRVSSQVSKVPLLDMENSQVYSTIDKSVIESQQANSMEEAMRNATGVSVVFPATGRATDGGTYYTSRGFTTNASLTNGIAGAVYSNPDAENIDQVVILKGPSATLFGSSLTSFGGAINTITKKPYDSLGGKVTVTTGSWGLNRYALDFNSPVTKDKSLLFRLTGAYHYQNSFQDYGFTKRFSVAPVIAYKPSDKLSLVLEANYSSIQATLPQWYYADSATTGVISADKLSIDPMKYYFPGDLYPTTKTANSMATMVYKLSRSWKSQTVFSTSHNHSEGPITYLWFISDTSLTRNNQTFEGGNTQVNFQQNFMGDITIGKIRNRILVGADIYQNASNSTYKWYSNINDTVYTNIPNANYMDYNKANFAKADFFYFFGSYTGIQKIRRTGFYVSDVVSISDRLHINAAIRYDYFTSDGYSNPTLDTMIDAYKQGGFSPKLGVVYQIWKNRIATFMNYQNSFQNVNGRDINGNRFVPQQANQLEGGVKFNFLDDKLYGMVTLYTIDVTNTLRTDPQNPLFSIQDGTQRSEGVETEITTASWKGFSLTAGYGYNNSRFVKSNPDVEGRRPVQSGAAHLAHAWLQYEISSGLLKGIGVGAGGNYSSKKYTNNDTFYGVFYNPAYLVVNAGIYYNQSKYRFGLNVNNATDERYWVGWNSSVLQKPREIVVSAAWKF